MESTVYIFNGEEEIYGHIRQNVKGITLSEKDWWTLVDVQAVENVDLTTESFCNRDKDYKKSGIYTILNQYICNMYYVDYRTSTSIMKTRLHAVTNKESEDRAILVGSFGK